MATSRDSSLGYKTYVVGTVKPVIEAKKILVYNKYKFSKVDGYSRISLYNLNDIYNLVSSYIFSNNNNQPACIIMRRNSADESFYYHYADSRGIEGFNVIIYLSDFDNSPIGYTEFLRTQGKDRNIKITLALESTVLGGISVKLDNSLAPLRNPSAQQRVFTGDELWDFTSSNKIYSSLSNITPISRYTAHLTAFDKFHSKRNIYQTNALVRKVGGNVELEKLGITKDLEVNPFSNVFTNHQVSYYGNNLALFSWKKEDGENNTTKLLYSITSLTERNIFGRQIYYTVNDDATKEIPDFQGDVDYFAGNYIVKKDGTIFDTQSNMNIPHSGSPNYTSFIDPRDPKSRLYIFPRIDYTNVFQYIPELAWAYLDIIDYGKTHSLNVVRKIGSWFILKNRTARNEVASYILVNQNSLYHITEEDYNNLFIVNDSVFMIKENDYYLLYFLNEGEYMTERYRAYKRGTTITVDPNLEVYFCNSTHSGSDSDTIENEENEDQEYRNYFIQNKIARVFKSFPIYDTVLDLYRKNYYEEENTTIPDIIDCCDGLFFYIQDNILKYI